MESASEKTIRSTVAAMEQDATADLAAGTERQKALFR
jgi:hypothetical protein